MNPPVYDVAIVGLGPVGCLATILLAEAGLRVIAFEKEPEVYRLPRAVNLDGEIIRALQPAGYAESVDALMQTMRPGERAGFANSKREWLFGATSRPVGSNGWQPMNMFDQPELEQFLRDTALKYDTVTAQIGAEVTACEDGADYVTVRAHNHACDEEHHAHYVLACDGASSPIRKALNIDWRDLGYDREWLVVDVTVNDKHTLGNDVLQVCDPDRLHTYVPTKDPYRRWEFRLNPGETREDMLREDTIRSLLNRWTPNDSYTIRRAAVYQFHAATASQWQRGRIFLAGDAAHQTPPFLGQGMNAGMRDVINLGWKIPLVINGACRPDLLATYQAERDAHAHDLVAWAVALGRLMEFVAEQEACERRGAPPPEPPADMASAGYGQGREQPPIRAGVVVSEQVSNDGITGYLFNQPVVSTQSETCKLDTLLGSGFALAGFGLNSNQLNTDSRRTVDRLNIRLLDLNDLELKQGKLSKIPQGESVLIRPDKIVYGHTSESLPVDALLASLAADLRIN